MPKDPKKFAEFEAKLTALLDAFGYIFVVHPFFTDKLGNKHSINMGGDIGAELQVNEKKDGTESGD